jgi:hypothetical protein
MPLYIAHTTPYPPNPIQPPIQRCQAMALLLHMLLEPVPALLTAFFVRTLIRNIAVIAFGPQLSTAPPNAVEKCPKYYSAVVRTINKRVNCFSVLLIYIATEFVTLRRYTIRYNDRIHYLPFPPSASSRLLCKVDYAIRLPYINDPNDALNVYTGPKPRCGYNLTLSILAVNLVLERRRSLLAQQLAIIITTASSSC